jgi:transglutaminase-like putative cysteine protease
MDNAFASLRSSVGIVSDYYGPNLSLGRGNRLTDSVVFIVQVPPEPPKGTRYYWRARVYDQYDNGWVSTLKTTQALPANEFDLAFPDMADNAPGEFSFAFTLGVPVATLFTPAQPIWLSRPTQAELAFNPDGTVDLASLRATPALRSGETYNVRASLNQVTIAALRKAGGDYPEWVTERYLQLPSTITSRTRNLAAELAQGRDNAYDVAVIITNYLRSEIEYSETVPTLPNNQELVDWFLFDLKTGFCNYYATSEVVLLRLLGIPARLAVGYAQGEPQEQEPIYTIRQKDIHAWPEVYFPGYGWVEFEPTAAQPLLVRPLGESVDSSTDNVLDPPFPPLEGELPFDRSELDPAFDPNSSEAAARQARLYIGILAILAVALGTLLIGVWKGKEIRARLPGLPISLENNIRRLGFQPPRFLQNWAFIAGLSPLQKAYLELNRALRRLGKPPAQHDTPAERAAVLSSELPPAQPPTSTLLREYHAATYSPSPNGDLEGAARAGSEIRLLSYKAWLRRLFTEPDPRKKYRRF